MPWYGKGAKSIYGEFKVQLPKLTNKVYGLPTFVDFPCGCRFAEKSHCVHLVYGCDRHFTQPSEPSKNE